ncbi:MAG: RsmB/NOP family class I SAM-dependent RNA methyltransferase [Candidatus Pacearchaeota archaeon]|jgi:NOL1/NOP2/sun family putative RNA methylase
MRPYHEPKPALVERMKILLNDENDLKAFFEMSKIQGRRSIRVNTLKISPEDLIKRLREKNWNVSQPITNHPEIIQICSELLPGALGKSEEHLLGYYYVQEITSMMPILALQPKTDEIMLDLCAAPGSKTTQAAALMENKGTIIANDLNIGRISILSANLERFGITNTIITRHDGLELCERIKKSKTRIKFDKILVDAPCSGEGNIRCSPGTYLEWSENLLKSLGKRQKKLASAALELLKVNGEMIYSTCTHSPEENEEVIEHLLNNYDIEIKEIKLPIKFRPGISEWKGKTFSEQIKKAARIYHHDNDLEGFFLCKIKKLSEERKGGNL